MKKLLSLALLGAFGATIVGCQASVDVDPPKHTTGTNVDSKTTTVKDANGNVVEKKTEIRNNP